LGFSSYYELRDFMDKLELSDEDKKVCKLIMDGSIPREIVKELGITMREYNASVERIGRKYRRKIRSIEWGPYNSGLPEK